MTTLHQIQGDVFHVLPRLPACWAHGVVSDFPYLIDFMGRSFDRQHRRGEGSEAERAMLWNLAICRELYRVLVPGAHAVVFQGSRTYHRLAYAAELAGFAVRPMLCGITGQAMAQGGAVGKLIDREAGAAREATGSYACPGDDAPLRDNSDHLGVYSSFRPGGSRTTTRPATPLAHDFEGWHSRTRDQCMPIALLLKPPEGSLARNAARWGVAGLWADGCRVEATPEDVAKIAAKWNDGTSTDPGGGVAAGRSRGTGQENRPNISRGRFPGNVLLDAAAADEVGRQSGYLHPGVTAGKNEKRGATGTYSRPPAAYRDTYSDHGTAARYFPRFRYVSRASKFERMRGLETWHWTGDPQHPEGWRRVSVDEWQALPRRRQMVGSNHPTLKPLELVRWVARLALPPPGPEATAIRERTTGSRARVLVPFSGVLSEAIGCALAGWSEVVAVEMSASYVAQGACRWRAWGPYSEARADAVEVAGGVAKAVGHEGQGALFDL